MTIEIIVATLEHQGYDLHTKIGIKTDALICNQSNTEESHTLETQHGLIRYITTADRGAAANRNMGILRAKGDILLFADDDIKYHDNYASIVAASFTDNPSADIILFNFKTIGGGRKAAYITRPHRVKWYNAFRYGAINIAIRRSVLNHSNVWFHMLFGPGAVYPSGEDSLFLNDCLLKKLKILALPIEIGVTYQESSSWFSGYTADYYWNKGALFAAISRLFYPVYIIAFLLRHKEYKTESSFAETLQFMRKGAKSYSSRELEAFDVKRI